MAVLTQADYVINLRGFLKDYDINNRLLKFMEENDDSFLKLYLDMALGFFSTMPPLVSSFSYATFPIPSLLIHQATMECLISNQIVQARNDLTYNNGGITVKVDDRDRYMRLIQLLNGIIDREINSFKQIKISLNIDSGWGGVNSPYSYLHGRSTTLQPNSILDG